ncbi:MAG: site-specific integrase, partial [Lachnospiraceae bacterium]|nr:site-specific integrase [Lachnospiraceae bacterium]
LVDNGMTLDEWFDIWMDTCKKNCRNSSRRVYKTAYNRLSESLGWRKLSTLNLLTLQKTFNDLPSDASRKYSKAILVDMLNKAQESDLIVKNVALKVNTVIDNTQKEEKRILTQDEIDLLLKESYNSYLYPILVVALNTGMRIGEIIGLTWDCIDFENNFISVRKTLCYLPELMENHYEFHLPKTKAGNRDIPMGIKVKEVLEQQKKVQEEKGKSFPPKEGFEKLVFTGRRNNPINTPNISESFERLVRKINKKNQGIILYSITPHTLRHTFASNCIAKGMRPKTLQKILGHSSLKMTMDLYCHVSDDTIKQEMSAVIEMV